MLALAKRVASLPFLGGTFGFRLLFQRDIFGML